MSKLLTARLGSEIAQQANVRHNGTGNGMTVSLVSFTLGWLLKCCLHPGTKYWCVVAISVYFAPLRTRFTRMSSKSIQLWHAMYFLERPAPASSFSSNWKRCNTFCFHSLPGWQNGSWKGREFGLCCAQPIWLVLSLVTREQTGLAMALQVPKLAMQRTNLSSQARKASWGMRVGSRQSQQHILWSCIHWYLIRICNCWEPFVMCVCVWVCYWYLTSGIRCDHAWRGLISFRWLTCAILPQLSGWGCDTPLLETSITVREKLRALRAKTEAWLIWLHSSHRWFIGSFWDLLSHGLVLTDVFCWY